MVAARLNHLVLIVDDCKLADHFKAMGGPVEIIVEAGQAKAEQALAAVRNCLHTLECRYSRYRNDSLVQRINQLAGAPQWVDIDEEFNSLLDHAQTMYAESAGRFDLTSGVFRKLWDFSARKVDDEQQLACIRPLVGWEKLERRYHASRAQVRLAKPGMEIDFGGIVKEFAVDASIQCLRELGIKHALVNMAGDLRVLGRQRSGAPWLVGIQHPRDPDRLIAQIPLVDTALATSGDYARRLTVGDQRFSHLIDAKTARPVKAWQSISVLAPTTLMAGTCSTIAMLLEAEALTYLRQKQLRFLAIAHDGEVFLH